jgi:predicted PhzF superfamily epimerase YddE/YHI9
MQKVAAELNLSETAFVQKVESEWTIRWFTPVTEVSLCGHATLAAAHVIWEIGNAGAGKAIRFNTLESGMLECWQKDGGIEMNFPSIPVVPTEPPPHLEAGLGARPLFCGLSRFDLLVELATENEIRSLVPDYSRLAMIDARGVIVTSAGTKPFDFVSRFFAPRAGINEDPVTGSAHCALGPYWQAKLGRSELRAWQASHRGGELGVRVSDERVFLSGNAITVWSGQTH